MPAARICLLNMPFASPEAPSIALQQLKAVLDQRLGECASVEVLYLHLDFVEVAGGVENYRRMTTGLGRLAGASDWLFRAAAFPDAPDNTEAYLDRFYFDEDEEEARLGKAFILAKRPDLPAFLDALIDEHRLAEADIVGFSSMFYQTVASFAMARRIKDRNPKVVTAIGGAACEAEMGLEIARRVEAIDYVFSGPALVSFPEFVERQLAGDLEGRDRIHGVFSRSNLARVLRDTGTCAAPGSNGNALRPTGDELDINANIVPDYNAFLDRFEATFPGGELRPMLMFETSRGCSWGEKIACTFCGLNGTAMRYRQMRPDNALAQLRALFEYLPRCNFFLAVDTIVPGEYFDELFPRLATPEGCAMMYEVRPTLDEGQIATLCRAGVLVVQPGIESLATSTLKLMHKGTTAFGNLRFLKACSKTPLRVEWNLLIGSPGEDESTWEKYRRELPLLSHLHPPTGAFPISFDRFSQYFLDPEKHGVDLSPQEYYGYAYPFGPDGLEGIAYHFVDRNSDLERIDAWLDRLNALVGWWWTRWENRDGREESRLYLTRDGEAASIYDSRSGEVVEYPLTETAAAMLAFLDSPRRPERLAKEFGEEEAERELAFFGDRGLLFEERGRLMSLVIR